MAAGRSEDGRRRSLDPALVAGLTPKVGVLLEPFTWPPPSTLVTGGRRWPQAVEFDTDDPRLQVGVAWLQSVSSAVRTERFALRMTRQQLADAAGVSYNAIKDLEAGSRWPSWQTLTSACAVLGLRLEINRSDGDVQPEQPNDGPSQQ